MIKASVIGCGVMGSHHARIYKELDILDSVCDVDIEKALNLQHIHGGKQVFKVETLLKCPPDIVSIAVPTLFHYDVAKKCLEAGCHVLIEKPITSTVQEAEKLINLASSKNLILATGYIERFNPAICNLEKNVLAGNLGKITSVNIKRVGGIPRSANNVIIDLMTHDLNILLALFKKQPLSVYTHKEERDNIIDSAQVLLDFGSASATCESNWISPVKIRRIEVTGTEASMTIDLIAQTSTFIKKDVEQINKYNQEPLKIELEQFIAAVNKDPKAKIITGESALETLILTNKVASS